MLVTTSTGTGKKTANGALLTDTTMRITLCPLKTAGPSNGALRLTSC